MKVNNIFKFYFSPLMSERTFLRMLKKRFFLDKLIIALSKSPVIILGVNLIVIDLIDVIGTIVVFIVNTSP